MKHETLLTVRSYECDSNGHVNHAVYVNYLEHARVQFLHAGGFDYKGMIANGFSMVISHVDLSYRLPAFADDELQIETDPRETRRVSGLIHQIVRRGADILAEADVTWCIVDRAGRPTRPPAEYDLRRLAP